MKSNNNKSQSLLIFALNNARKSRLGNMSLYDYKVKLLKETEDRNVQLMIELQKIKKTASRVKKLFSSNKRIAAQVLKRREVYSNRMSKHPRALLL
jgi:hypothetical protein